MFAKTAIAKAASDKPEHQVPELDVSLKHHLGSFQLDVAFRIQRWPALLFGPSGAGKSTLLRLIAGLERPQEASITFGSRVLADTKARIRLTPGAGGIQLVTQRAALFPHLTVRQNVAFGTGAKDRADGYPERILAMLHAEHLRDRYPHRLSGGEQKRVALARALAARPELLLLDEAFVGLDATLKQEILADMTVLLSEQKTVALHVTHEVSDAYALNTETILLATGRVTCQGPASEVLAGERDRILQILG